MRFVILEHDSPTRGLHWDLMLENDAGSLTTWALDKKPRLGETCTAIRLDDHRIEYLTYEGPISNNRGHVTQWDAGTYESTTVDDCLRITLTGKRLVCDLELKTAVCYCRRASTNYEK